ncbi:hypothetical protein C8035_v009507 [Colletotrichum spinosum]|uniref:Secreted protein n=1 Tax=Colletotrichum spinosum TaxID=1347390 RepID=A0A4R8PQ02_9PEZI|nr:hypothetical protein C8035_v009507 [Colletotrichum spinosum]
MRLPQLAAALALFASTVAVRYRDSQSTPSRRLLMLLSRLSRRPTAYAQVPMSASSPTSQAHRRSSFVMVPPANASAPPTAVSPIAPSSGLDPSAACLRLLSEHDHMYWQYPYRSSQFLGHFSIEFVISASQGRPSSCVVVIVVAIEARKPARICMGQAQDHDDY